MTHGAALSFPRRAWPVLDTGREPIPGTVWDPPISTGFACKHTHGVFRVYTTPHSEPNILRLSNVITYEDIEQLRAIYTIHDSSDH